MTSYVVIQPIDVCGTAGPSSATGCAPFNTLSKSPNPTQATLTTPIGFVDTTTNINLTRAIWLQAGIDVTFLPIVEYNNTTDQVIEIDCSTATISCTGGTLTSSHFKALSSGTPGTTSGCSYDCAVPLAPAIANAINMFFVNSLTGGTGVTGTLFGFAWINSNGVAISKPTFSPGGFAHPNFDTPAHELGHNLNLDHTTFGDPQPGTTTCPGSPLPTPGGCNVMDAGSIRIIPASTGCTAQSMVYTSSTGGALYDLDTGLCSGTRTQNYPIADQIILGSNTIQQGQALLSGFLNPIPNASATAGGGINTTAATAMTTSTNTTNTGILFTITDNGSGRDSEGEFVNNIIIALANGLDVGGNKAVTLVSGPPFQVNKLNGNNGINPNCNKQVGLAPPATHCIQLVYQPGTFTPGQTSQFTLQIAQNDQPLTDPTQVAGSQFSIEFETDATGATPGTNPVALFATTGDFAAVGGMAQANSQNPDPTIASVILNAATFQGTPNSQTGQITACTPQPSENGFFCPPQAGGDPTGPD
ncbi:MAG TPA: hypothetical protein VGS13_03095 [Stellaceae bacterium]|nr:hypothetical protein [Stellaceae bacterium]